MKRKALISFAVTTKLICVFVFAYAKSRSSHDAARFMLGCYENTVKERDIEATRTLYANFWYLGSILRKIFKILIGNCLTYNVTFSCEDRIARY